MSGVVDGAKMAPWISSKPPKTYGGIPRENYSHLSADARFWWDAAVMAGKAWIIEADGSMCMHIVGEYL